MSSRKRKPRRPPPSGFSFWDFVGLLPINPLTDVVANYTCHDRNKKRIYVQHEPTSFLTEEADLIIVS